MTFTIKEHGLELSNRNVFFTNSFYPHVYLPGQLSVEEGIDQDTVNDLKLLGHQVVRAAVCGMGAAITRRDPDTGILSAGADPRRACYALGW